jgi:hypothetical protein
MDELKEVESPYRYPARYERSVDIEELNITINQYLWINFRSAYSTEKGEWEKYETIKVRMSKNGTPIIVLEKDSKVKIHYFDEVSGDEIIPKETNQGKGD